MSQFKIYTSCEELPLQRFIRCIVDQDLAALIIKGTPPAEELAEAWGNIYAEYLDLNQDNEAIYLLHLQRDIWLLRYSTTEVSSVLICLAYIHHEGLVQTLRDRGYQQPLDPANQDQYRRNLETISNSIAADKLQLEMKETELAGYIASRSNETIDKNYFTRMLVKLSKHMGFWQRAKDITVAEFIQMIKDLLASQKQSPNKVTDGNEG